MTSMTDFSCCSAMILIQLLAAVKEMRCQKQKCYKPEQKIITSRNVLQIIPLKIQLHCFSSLLIPKIFLFSNHWIETHFNSMKLRTWWHKCLSSYARLDMDICKPNFVEKSPSDRLFGGVWVGARKAGRLSGLAGRSVHCFGCLVCGLKSTDI